MGHSATLLADGKQVIVFGGCKQLKWFSDMFALCCETLTWSPCQVCFCESLQTCLLTGYDNE
jgi:hypothetical protein